MIAWPFLTCLKSSHLCDFRTEWGTFLQSNQEMEPGAPEGLTLCLGSWQPGVSQGVLVWVRLPQAYPTSLILCREWLMEQVFHFSRKEGCAGSSQTKENHLWLPSVSREQSLGSSFSSFLTLKLKEMVKERIYCYHRWKRGMVGLPTSTCQLSCAFWSIFAELSKRGWKFFPDERRGLRMAGPQNNNCTEWHFIFF